MPSIAGTETLSITVSYLFWELTRRPDIYAQLREEIDTFMPDSHSIPDHSILQTLPYLNAFIKEGNESEISMQTQIDSC